LGGDWTNKQRGESAVSHQTIGELRLIFGWESVGEKRERRRERGKDKKDLKKDLKNIHVAANTC